MPFRRHSKSLAKRILVLTLAPLCLATIAVPAQVPEYFTLQGQVRDSAGDPLTGEHSITVRLYDGGRVVYSQTMTGSTVEGQFTMHLGPVDFVVFGEPLQVGITVDSDPEMPRIDVVSAPYALGLRGLRVENSTHDNKPPNLIGGASTNSVADGLYGVTIGGGGDYGTDEENRVEQQWGTIGGGLANHIQHATAVPPGTIAGGYGNTIDGSAGTIGGGTGNVAGYNSVVAGGVGNDAYSQATVGGGAYNVASGANSTIPGGLYNAARGFASFAAGLFARANHDGSFVWQDRTGGAVDTLATFKENQFRARASGGFYFQTAPAPNLGTGARLNSNEGAWEALSSRDAKKDFSPVDVGRVLRLVDDLEISSWRYRTQDEPVRHIGPVSEDFYAAFGFGSDDEHISTIDADGVALAAIQGLYQIVKKQQQEIEKLKGMMN